MSTKLLQIIVDPSNQQGWELEQELYRWEEKCTVRAVWGSFLNIWTWCLYLPSLGPSLSASHKRRGIFIVTCYLYHHMLYIVYFPLKFISTFQGLLPSLPHIRDWKSSLELSVTKMVTFAWSNKIIKYARYRIHLKKNQNQQQKNTSE